MIPDTRGLGRWQKEIMKSLSVTENGEMDWDDLIEEHPRHGSSLRKAASTLANIRGYIGIEYKNNTRKINKIKLTSPGIRKCYELKYITEGLPLYEKASYLKTWR